jgi:hypothetical protein
VAEDSGKNVRRLLLVIVEVDGVVADINIIFKMGVKIRARRHTLFFLRVTHVQCALLFLYFILVQILNRETTRAAVLNLRVHAG